MICAWCSTPIGPEGRRSGLEHNYGMCRRCVEEQIARLAPNCVREPLDHAARLARVRPAGFSTVTSG